MPSSIIFQAGGVSVATGANRYLAIGNGNNNFTFFTGSSVEVPWPFDCTFRNLYFTVEANSRTGITSGNLQLELYKNGSATGLTATFSAGATGTFSDTTNSVSVTAGDLLAWRANGATGGTGNWTLGSMSVQLDHSSDAPTTFLCYNAGGQLGTGYTPLASGTTGLRNTGTESSTQVDTIAGTFNYLTVSISSNSRNGTEDVWLRKNGVDTALTVQVPASTTGNFSDTSNTVTVSTGDDVNYRLLRGGSSGAIVANYCSIGFTADDDRFQVYGGGDAAFSPTASTDYYMPIGGLLENNTTLAHAQQTWTLDSMQADRFEVNVSTNNITLDSFIYLQIDGVDTDVSINIPNETTGRFTNISDTAALADGDLVSYRLLTDEAGNITIRSTALAFSPVAGENHTAELPVGAIEISALAPTASTTENHLANLPVGAIEISALAPSASTGNNHFAELPVGTIELSGLAPTANVTENNIASLPVGQIEIAAIAPTAETTETDPNHTANLPVGVIALAALVPTATTTGDQIIGNLDVVAVELDALDVVAIELDALDVAVTVIQ